jgi:hypothetical protein
VVAPASVVNRGRSIVLRSDATLLVARFEWVAGLAFVASCGGSDSPPADGGGGPGDSPADAATLDGIPIGMPIADDQARTNSWPRGREPPPRV